MNSEPLLFKNPVFVRSEKNVTVRRGTKWVTLAVENKVLPVMDANHQIDDQGHPTLCGYAYNFKTKVKRFHDLTLEDIKHEHDLECRDYAGLRAAMVRAYPDFDDMEIVTILEFDFSPIIPPAMG